MDEHLQHLILRDPGSAVERSRVVATDAPTSVLGDAAEGADEEARRQALRDEAEWTQQTVASAEGRLQALRAEVAAVEADLADRQRELAGLREQIARERAGGAAPPAGAAGRQPEGGGSPPR